MKKNVVILIGAPGSGKGTQAKVLSKEYAIPHISTGDLFRLEVEKNTDLGKKVSVVMASGKLVDDETTSVILDNRLKQADTENGFILDGYPRNFNQLEQLNTIFSSNNINAYKVIYIDVNKDVLEKRILGRYTCNNCGAIYNKYFSTLKVEGICDVCGSSDFNFRSDDNLESFQKRMTIYEEQSKPIINYYKEKGLLFRVEGSANAEEIKKELKHIID